MSKTMKKLFRCPECESPQITVTEETMFMVNTMEYLCQSVKAYDYYAKIECLQCNWVGIHEELLEDE